jgi:thiamine-monophosphate kinase
LSTPGKPPAAPVSSIGERGVIDRIRRRLPTPPSSIIVGIGDDAAVVAGERRALQVLTTDALVERVHFDRRFSHPSDIGYKALAVNVSDVVAMGATPLVALLSLMLPADTTIDDVDGLLDGLLEMAAGVPVTLVGGNITRSPGPLVIDVTLTGSVHPRKVLKRSGGRPGDQLFLSGSIGGAAAGLSWLQARAANPADRPDDPALAECVRRHVRPEPQARLGMMVGRNRAASACMDLSDGLADAVRQVAEASGTGARIDLTKLPVHPGAAEWFTSIGQDPVMSSVRGGDDYELLFAVPPRAKGRFRNAVKLSRGVSVTRIGELTSARELTMVTGGIEHGLPDGFVHF